MLKNLFLIQNRLFKSVYVSDEVRAFYIQKIILNSNSARLLSIREVTQFQVNRKVSGLDGKTSLSFTERFELNEKLKFHVFNWFPSGIRRIKIFRKCGKIDFLNISTISDRAWQCLVNFSLQPSHEAVFNFRNLGFRSLCSIFDVQKLIILNLTPSSSGFQKRILIFKFENCVSDLNYEFLLKKLIAPRSIKYSIFRSLKRGLLPRFYYSQSSNDFDLASLFMNIILDGIEDFVSSIRYGYDMVSFLQPHLNETIIVDNIKFFLTTRGFSNTSFFISIFSPNLGFDYLNWNFKLSKSREVICTPSFDDYQLFLRRVKHIINNSNFGALRSC